MVAGIWIVGGRGSEPDRGALLELKLELAMSAPSRYVSQAGDEG